MFLSRDEAGRLDFVILFNDNRISCMFTLFNYFLLITIIPATMRINVEITGAIPTSIALYDDPAPEDIWYEFPVTYMHSCLVL